jgi:hypothetical protein
MTKNCGGNAAEKMEGVILRKDLWCDIQKGVGGVAEG